jgi:hypothetical protein
VRSETPTVRQSTNGTLAAVLLASGAWVSLDPYFLWGTQWALLVAAMTPLAAGAFALLDRNARGALLSELLGIGLLTAFVVYITLQPRTDGGHTRWIVVLPMLWALWVLSDRIRRDALNVFCSIFALTLVPSVAVSIWMMFGLPVTFSTIPAAHQFAAQESVRLLYLPGVLFTESNSIVLPWGGLLSRLNGWYDEPGTVGTIGGLLLVAYGCKLRCWRTWTVYVAGVLSFSLAFIAITTIGFLARAIVDRRIRALLPIVPLAVGALLATGQIDASADIGTKSAISAKPAESPSDTETIAMSPELTLRQQAYLDNRSLPAMQELLREYWASDAMTVLFGMASDMSVVKGGFSQIWTRHLVNHGLFGFALLLGGCFAVSRALWVRLDRSSWALLFFSLYALSAYQRPVVWLPYNLLLLFCGPLISQGMPRRKKV